MALSKPYEAKIWTSSHGTDYHYFPNSLLKAFNENTHPRRDSLIQLPSINAIPGRQTKEAFVREIRKMRFEKPKRDNFLFQEIFQTIHKVKKGDYARCLAFSGLSSCI
jgi:hypothetical protein